MQQESTPLLAPTAGEVNPPTYEEQAKSYLSDEAPSVQPSAPPPYSDAPVLSPSDPMVASPSAPISQSGVNAFYVQCRVCSHIINIIAGSNSRVVKCPNCHEATPIADPPPGKKYVRCPCNCLLTCTATATRVVCPRSNCKRTIGIGTTQMLSTTSDTGGRVSVCCGRCHRTILWPANEAVARCPHCHCKSYLHTGWMHRRAAVLATLGVLFILIGVGVTVGTYELAKDHGGIIVFYIGAFLTGFSLLIASGRYCVMTRSVYM